MQIFTNTNHLEDIFQNSAIMESDEIIDLYIIDKEPVDIMKIMLKLGPILYRSKYHVLTMYLDIDIINYIQAIGSDNMYCYFEESILEKIKIKEKMEISEDQPAINTEISTTNKKGKYPFKEEAKKDLKDGMSITAVMNKYNCARSLIYSWKRELDKIGQESVLQKEKEYEREKIVKGLTETSPKFEIDTSKVFSEEDGTIYYIDYQWHIKIKEYFEKIGIQIPIENIWVIEKILEEYLEMPIDTKVFEAVLRKNEIKYSPGIIQGLYEIYIEITEEYQNKDKFQQLYSELYN